MVIIGATQVTDMEINVGILFLFIAAVSASVYMIIQRRILQKYTTIQATAYSIFCGTAFMLIFLPRLINEFTISLVSVNLIVVYLGAFPAALAYFLWGYALSKAEKTIYVTNFLYLVPFVSSLIAFLWLGEIMPMLAFAGGFVVIAGMVIINVYKSKSN
jgi:drug/metabolite transporter (DMT)-like permease